MKKILLANDHGGLTIKKAVMDHLKTRSFGVKDLGCNTESAVDYPDYVQKLCDEYLQGGYECGILICGTGIGVSIAANRIKGIRCAVVHDPYSAKMAKQHNHANVLALGGRVEYKTPLKKILDAYLDSAFDNANRHQKRLQKIETLSAKHVN